MRVTKIVIGDLTCPICGKKSEVTITYKEFCRLQEGRVIISASTFPSLNAEQRELIITGTCQQCWDKMFEDKE